MFRPARFIRKRDCTGPSPPPARPLGLAPLATLVRIAAWRKRGVGGEHEEGGRGGKHNVRDRPSTKRKKQAFQSPADVDGARWTRSGRRSETRVKSRHPTPCAMTRALKEGGGDTWHGMVVPTSALPLGFRNKRDAPRAPRPRAMLVPDLGRRRRSRLAEQTACGGRGRLPQPRRMELMSSPNGLMCSPPLPIHCPSPPSVPSPPSIGPIAPLGPVAPLTSARRTGCPSAPLRRPRPWQRRGHHSTKSSGPTPRSWRRGRRGGRSTSAKGVEGELREGKDGGEGGRKGRGKKGEGEQSDVGGNYLPMQGRSWR